MGQGGLHQMGEHGAFAGCGTLAGFGDAAVEFGEFGGGEAGAVGHALAQGQFGKVAQLFHGGGGHFDDVAELRVVADLQAGDAVALGVVELQRGEHAAAVVAQGAFGVEFGSKPGRMTLPSSSRCGAGSARASVRRWRARGRVAGLCGRSVGVWAGQRRFRAMVGEGLAAGTLTRLTALADLSRERERCTEGDFAARAAARPSRNAARSRGPPRLTDSRASARAMSGADRSAARSFSAAACSARTTTRRPGARRWPPCRSAARPASRPACAHRRGSVSAAPCRAASAARHRRGHGGSPGWCALRHPSPGSRRGPVAPGARDAATCRPGSSARNPPPAAAAIASASVKLPNASRLAAPKVSASRRRATRGGDGATSGARLSDHSPSGSVAGARISAGSSRPSRLGSSASVGAAVSNRPVETSSQAAPIPSWPCASASSRLARPASSRASSVIVPGVIETHHGAADRRLAGAGLWVLHLLGHGDAEAAADQAGEIGFGRVLRYAAHRDGRAVVLAALGQRDVERGGGGFGVGEEQFVEVAHAEEHQRIRMRRLGGEPLRHRGGGAGGFGDGGHRCGLPHAVGAAKREPARLHCATGCRNLRAVRLSQLEARQDGRRRSR